MDLTHGVWQSKNKEAVGCLFHFAYKLEWGTFDLVFESPIGEIRTQYPSSATWVEIEVEWPESLTGNPVSYGFEASDDWAKLRLDDIRFIEPEPEAQDISLYGNVQEAGKSVTIKKDNAGEWKTIGTAVSDVDGNYRIPEEGFYNLLATELKEDNYQMSVDGQIWDTKFIPENEWVEEV